MTIDITELQSLQAKGLTVGVVAKDRSLRTRLELDDFIQDRDVANLYFLALKDFMEEPWNGPQSAFSFFQIAGIHGKPWERWDGVGPPNGEDTDPYSGYCSHSSILFPRCV
jgi:tyrosinase